MTGWKPIPRSQESGPMPDRATTLGLLNHLAQTSGLFVVTAPRRNYRVLPAVLVAAEGAFPVAARSGGAEPGAVRVAIDAAS